MILSSLARFVVPFLLLLCSCVAADGQSGARPGAVETTPYVSRLNAPESNALFHYARARLLLAEDKHDEAVEAYHQAIGYDSLNEDLRFELAELYLALDRPQQAFRLLEDLLIRNPDSLKASLTLGNAYFGNRQPEKAVGHYRKALELAPEQEQVRLHLAIALVRSGEIDEAFAVLKELLKKNPESIPGRLAIARLYRETGLAVLAEEQYKKLIDSNPELDQAYLELGLLYEEQKDWLRALDVFNQTLRRRPLDFTLRHHISRIYVGMERYEEALSELSIIVDLKPDDFDARRKIGLIHLEQERWEDAAAVFGELVALRPDMAPAHYYLGMAYERQEKWEQALEAFLGIPADSALYDDAIAHIGYIYLETGRTSEAVRLLEDRLAQGQPRPQILYYLTSLHLSAGEYEKALKVSGLGADLYPEHIDLLYQRGLVLERAGRHEDAMLVMRNLVSLDDKHAEALNFLAYALAVQNVNLDEALAFAERAIALKPAPHIMDTLGWVYFRLGRLIEALQVIREASLKLTEDAVIFEHLGDIHLALNNRDEAFDAFSKALGLDPGNVALREKLDGLASPQ